MSEEDLEGQEERKITLIPRGAGTMPTGNEHIIRFTGYGFREIYGGMGYFTRAFAQKINEIFPGSGNRGDRIEIYHKPTEEEIEKLRDLARELGASVEIKIRTDEELEEEFKELRAVMRELRR